MPTNAESLFLTVLLSSGTPCEQDLFVLHLPGKPCQVVQGRNWVLPELHTQLYPVRLPGGKLLYCSWETGDLEVYRLDSKGKKRLTFSKSVDLYPAAAPDGTVLFSSDRSGHWEIWRTAPDGTHPRPVTRFGAYTTHVLPLPNGDLVVSSDKDRPGTPDPKTADGHYDLFLLSPNGQVKKKLTHGPGDATSPALLPDGNLLFASNPSGRLEIHHLDLRTGQSRILTDSRLPDRERNVYAPVVMPNGRILVSVHETLRDPRRSNRELRWVALLEKDGRLIPLTDPRRSNASTKGF